MRFKQPICGPQALKSSKLVLMTFSIVWIYTWKTVGKIHSTKVSCVREEILFFYVVREKNHIFKHTISA